MQRRLWLVFTAVLCCVLVLTGAAMASEAPQLVDEASIPEVIKAITLEEKARLVVGDWTWVQATGSAGASPAIERVGIPPMDLADGPAGVRISPTREGVDDTFYATAFPIATLLASSWDVELVEEVGRGFGEELLEYGVDYLLAPGMNIHRDLRCGRNFEYYSEDPLVTGKMAAAMTRGVQSYGVGVTLKHFAVNNQETNRFTVDAVVSQRALREIYLKGFEIAVKEAKPWAIMSSYNRLNGVYTPQSYELLTSILREDWGYEGFVMTDWFAGDNPIEMMIAGNDMIQPGRDAHVEAIIAAVENGTLDEAILDLNAARILRGVVKSPQFRGYVPSNNPDLEAHAALSRRAATEGMILLENNGALPLTIDKRIAVFGNGQIETVKGGFGSGDVNARYTVSILEGLIAAGYDVYEELARSYEIYIKGVRQLPEYSLEGRRWGRAPVPPQKPLFNDEISKAEQYADAAIVVISRNSGEGRDRTITEGDYYLTADERDMIERVSAAFRAAGKPVIAVLNIPGPIEMVSWRGLVDAILLAWQPGQEAGHAIADVLSGKVNPSGKLATTIPVSYSDVPTAKNFPGYPEDNPVQVIYEEDIYVGYRYYSTFGVEPAYPFGYGLSYTSFDYNNIHLTTSTLSESDKVIVSVDVENVGPVAGKEVVQVYVTAPDGKLEKPALELKAFAKTKLLQPGEKQTLTFELDARTLASFDEKLSAWIVEAGDYAVHVAASSADIRGTVSFYQAHDIIVETVNSVLKPKMEINRLSKF